MFLLLVGKGGVDLKKTKEICHNFKGYGFHGIILIEMIRGKS